MIYDTSGPQRTAFDHIFGACVVGTGPAGVTLARRLAAAGIDVALMEGGDRDYTSESQLLYEGAVTGLDYFALDVARLRFFGGSSNHWSGYCRVLDARDFEPHPYQPLSGWPIRKSDLDPYRAAANEILDIQGWSGETHPPALPDAALQPILYRHSAPTRFAEKYAAEIEASDHLNLGLNANLVDLRLDASGAITEARFRAFTPGDPGFVVRAQRYILCAGGIENPRILLNARSQRPEGLGNEHGLVGRYFAEHPHINFGEILFREPFFAREHYAPTTPFMTETESLNFNVNVRETPGVELPLSLPKEVAREIVCRTPFVERLAQRVVDRTLRCDGGLGVRTFFDRREQPDALFGTADLQMEQVLNPENRVRLIAEADSLGLNRIALNWQFQEIDRHTARVAMRSFAALLAAQDRGRIRPPGWLLEDDWNAGMQAGDIIGSYHHMCTTRMSDDPRTGVVDRNCRVHGISNLYIGGSSVFATAGHATPTYSIVQLALRLGDHIAEAEAAGLSSEREAPADFSSDG